MSTVLIIPQRSPVAVIFILCWCGSCIQWHTDANVFNSTLHGTRSIHVVYYSEIHTLFTITLICDVRNINSFISISYFSLSLDGRLVTVETSKNLDFQFWKNACEAWNFISSGTNCKTSQNVLIHYFKHKWFYLKWVWIIF